MFPRCAKRIKSAPTIAAVNNGRTSATGTTNTLRSNTNTGIITAAIIEPSDTYRVNKTMLTKMTPAHSNAIGASTRKAPTPVATPLPPRNPSHTGKTWPTITAIAAAVNIHSSPLTLAAINTAAAPFNASSTSVKIPAALPARRETFVAPVPPDPVCLISAPTCLRTIKYPNGIEPSRYAIITMMDDRKELLFAAICSETSDYNKTRLKTHMSCLRNVVKLNYTL